MATGQQMLDQLRGWRDYARLEAKQTDPRRKEMARLMKDHYKWEVLGEPDEGQPMAWFMPYSSGDASRLRGENAFLSSRPLTVRKPSDGEDLFEPVTDADFAL